MPKTPDTAADTLNAQTALPTVDVPHEAISLLLSLFEDHAELLRFPDVDAEKLAEVVSEVEQRRDAVEQASLALADAREALVLMEQQLLEKARKGHAYASVFAAEDAEMQEKLVSVLLWPCPFSVSMGQSGIIPMPGCQNSMNAYGWGFSVTTETP